MKTTEAIAKPCVDDASRPAVPHWPAIDVEHAASQQLAAAAEAYIGRLELYAEKANALLIGCSVQPQPQTEKKP